MNGYGRNRFGWYSCCCPLGFFCSQRNHLEIEGWMLNLHWLAFWEFIRFFCSFFLPFPLDIQKKLSQYKWCGVFHSFLSTSLFLRHLCVFQREKSFAFFFLHSYIVVFVRGDLVNESCNVKMFSAIVLGHMFVLIEKKIRKKGKEKKRL